MYLLHVCSHILCGLMGRWRKSYIAFSNARMQWKLSLLCGLLTCGMLVASCSLGGNDAKTNAPAVPAMTELSQLRWCNKPVMVFRDKKSNKLVTDWATIKAALGFEVYLPARLPAGSCLVSAFGTLYDPIFGGKFTIGYLLPDHSSLSISQAPLRSKNLIFQCNPAGNGGEQKGVTPAVPSNATQGAVQLCSGAREKTNIVFSSKGNTEQLQQFFKTLQSGVDWMPKE